MSVAVEEEVLRVPHLEWHWLKSTMERVAYLKQLLAEGLMVLAIARCRMVVVVMVGC